VAVRPEILIAVWQEPFDIDLRYLWKCVSLSPATRANGSGVRLPVAWPDDLRYGLHPDALSKGLRLIFSFMKYSIVRSAKTIRASRKWSVNNIS
jgi:hypothetical protein